MVVDMKVNKVDGMVVDMEVDMVADGSRQIGPR